MAIRAPTWRRGLNWMCRWVLAAAALMFASLWMLERTIEWEARVSGVGILRGRFACVYGDFPSGWREAMPNDHTLLSSSSADIVWRRWPTPPAWLPRITLGDRPLAPKVSIRLPLWMPLLACVGLSALAWRTRLRRGHAGGCSRFGYDLHGLPTGGACPECGGKL